MNYPIPHLESILLLGAIIFPLGFGSNLSLLFGKHNSGSLREGLLGTVGAYVIIVALVLMIQPAAILDFHAPTSFWWYIAAPLIGIACIGLEYLVGMGILYLKTGTLVTRAGVHHTYTGPSKISFFDVLFIVLFVIGEELLLRQMLYRILANDFELAIGLVIAVCVLVYALNHVTFGVQSMIGKLFSGFVYVMVYQLAGLAVIIPILAHITQNLSLLTLARRK